MRNYIILNGKNSNEINGLLIQELPPISKPQIRTEVEEIDGRDGDIVTKLGFAAYDKEFTVGLYKDFDINAIIAYFNSEGTVVFSNEPDKYYNYQIIDQIDFERLVRYRTATVRMHCQPFKYSTEERTRSSTSLADKTFSITNSGNIYSKPAVTVYGTGTINLSLNGKQLFVIELGETDNYLTIDADKLEAYQDTTETLMNRSVDGDYNNLKLEVGRNAFTWSGELTKIEVSNYSRWI